MRHLLNTLFVTTENAYLSLDGENVVVNCDQAVMGRFPLHTLSGILSLITKSTFSTEAGAAVHR